jgi:hypothetical protein
MCTGVCKCKNDTVKTTPGIGGGKDEEESERK